MLDEDIIKGIDEAINAGKFSQALSLLAEQESKIEKSEILYVLKARVYWGLREYKTAFSFLENALKINKKYAEAYYIRGNLYHDKSEFNEALADFSDAIKLKPDFYQSYNERALCWKKSNNIDKALDDLNTAIKINPQYPLSYLNRGDMWGLLKKHDKAIKDYRKYSDLIPSDKTQFSEDNKILAEEKVRLEKSEIDEEYNNNMSEIIRRFNEEGETAILLRKRGILFFDNGEYFHAIKDYQKAISLNRKMFSFLLYEIEFANQKLKSRKGDSVFTNNIFYDLDNLFSEIKYEPNKERIRDAAICLIMSIERLKDHCLVKNIKQVAHYTKLSSAEKLISNETEKNWRLYNAIYMNDPREGKVLFDYLSNEKISDSFKDGKKFSGERNNIYLGSFLPITNDKNNSFEDDLIMWRTYGKDERNTEAAGCCLVIDTAFFGNKDTAVLEDSRRSVKFPIYRVLYYNKDSEKIEIREGIDNKALVEDLKELKKILLNLIHLKTDIKWGNEINERIDCFVYRVLSEMCYLFKPSDYSFENEYRIVQYAINKNRNVYVDETRQNKTYYDTEREIRPYIKKIVLGPKVDNPKNWYFLEVLMNKEGYEMDIQLSEKSFQ